MRSNKSINKITLYNFLSTVVLQGIAFFSTPYFSRVMGTDNYGLLAVFITWVQVITIVLGLRIQTAIPIGMAEYPEVEQKNFQSSILFLSLIVYIVSSAIIVFFWNFSGKNIIWIVFILLQGYGQHVVTFVNSKYSFEFKAKENAVLSVFVAASSITLSVYLVRNFPADHNHFGKIVGDTLVYLIVGLFFTFRMLYKREIVNRSYWKFAIIVSLPLVFHSLSGIVLSQSDRVMLQGMTNNSEVGIYSLAYSFSNVVFVCWSALNNTWAPFYYDYIKNRDTESIHKHSKSYLELFTILCIGFMLLAPEVFKVFAGKPFWRGDFLIPIFTFGNFMIFLYSFAINHETYFKRTKLIALGSLAAAVINILLNLMLIRMMGSTGAALATAFSYIMLFLFHHLCCVKIMEEKFEFSVRLYAPFILCVLCTSLILYFVGLHALVRWIVAFILGTYELYKIYLRKSIF